MCDSLIGVVFFCISILFSAALESVEEIQFLGELQRNFGICYLK